MTYFKNAYRLLKHSVGFWNASSV